MVRDIFKKCIGWTRVQQDYAVSIVQESALKEHQTLPEVAGRKVMIVINSDSAGGVEHLASLLSRDLERLGASVNTAHLYPDPRASRAAKLLGLAKAASRVAGSAPDILITFQPTSSVVATFVARLAGCRARIVHQSNLPNLTHPAPRQLDRWAGSLGFYTVNIMNSQATEREFSGYPENYRSRFRRIPHGIDWRAAAKERAQVRNEIDVPQDATLMLSCARLSEQKSLQTILSVLPDLPGTYFAIAGDGDFARELKQMAADLGVADRTRFLGRVDHECTFDLHQAADLFVFPSRSETFGIAGLEAAMFGLAVVASDIPVNREVLSLEKRSPVTFVQGWDPDNWRDAIRSALANPDLAQHAKAFGSELRQLYSVEEMFESYRRLYCEVLS